MLKINYISAWHHSNIINLLHNTFRCFLSDLGAIYYLLKHVLILSDLLYDWKVLLDKAELIITVVPFNLSLMVSDKEVKCFPPILVSNVKGGGLFIMHSPSAELKIPPSQMYVHVKTPSLSGNTCVSFLSLCFIWDQWK